MTSDAARQANFNLDAALALRVDIHAARNPADLHDLRSRASDAGVFTLGLALNRGTFTQRVQKLLDRVNAAIGE